MVQALTASEVAEQAARTSYGRLLALLAASSGDILAAEDALADAFERALTTWPERGVPDNPDAWLLTVGRNRLRDLYRSAAYRTAAPALDTDGAVADESSTDLERAVPDERLALLFVCAHPAIEPAARTPLMLQTVLGLDARRIAEAYAVPSGAMAQRLVRAKRRIRDARIPFTTPAHDELPRRLPAVLEAVYGAYAVDFASVPSTALRETLAGEAHYLAVLLSALLPDEPEALGLAALISLSLARSGARTDLAGSLIRLDDQDHSRWDPDLIAAGERLLRRASTYQRPGRFQLEAAIQSVHCDRARTGELDVDALVRLHRGLVGVAPTLGARVALAAALARADGPAVGLETLDALAESVPPDSVRRFQPAWALRADLLARLGRTDEAAAAYEKAISLTTDTASREFLRRGREALDR